MLVRTHAQINVGAHAQRNSLNWTIPRQRAQHMNTSRRRPFLHMHNGKQTLLHTLIISHTHACPYTHNRRPLIARLSNNHDVTSRGALASFAFHRSLLFKDTQGREWNHLSQREAQRLEAPPAEKPVYFGWHNTLGYRCERVYVCVCTHACFGAHIDYIRFHICNHPGEQLCPINLDTITGQLIRGAFLMKSTSYHHKTLK